MKAREIKKALIQERDDTIKEYDDAIKRATIEVEASAVKLRQLNLMLYKFFGVDEKWISTKKLIDETLVEARKIM